MEEQLEYFSDGIRVVCKPYSLGNIRKTARNLKIPLTFLKRGYAYIPPKKKKEVLEQTTLISNFELEDIMGIEKIIIKEEPIRIIESKIRVRPIQIEQPKINNELWKKIESDRLAKIIDKRCQFFRMLKG